MKAVFKSQEPSMKDLFVFRRSVRREQNTSLRLNYVQDFISQVQQGCVYIYVTSRALPQQPLMAPVIFPPLLPLNDKEILVFELNIHAGYQNFKCQKLGLSTFIQSTALHILGIKVRVVSMLGRCRNVFIDKRKSGPKFIF